MHPDQSLALYHTIHRALLISFNKSSKKKGENVEGKNEKEEEDEGVEKCEEKEEESDEPFFSES